MKVSDNVDKIAPAFLAAQKTMGVAHRDATNPFHGSKYADLSSVDDACRAALHANGIAILQPASSVDGVVYGVETILLHTSGQYFSDTLLLKPIKNDPQGAGSCITYARRYSLAAICGIMQQDDDGNKASANDSKANAVLYSETESNKDILSNYAAAHSVTSRDELRALSAQMIKDKVTMDRLQAAVKDFINMPFRS